MVEKVRAQERVVRRSVEEWVIFKLKLDGPGQVLYLLIKIQSMNNCFLSSSHGVSVLFPETQSHSVLLLCIIHTPPLTQVSSYHPGK